MVANSLCWEKGFLQYYIRGEGLEDLGGFRRGAVAVGGAPELKKLSALGVGWCRRKAGKYQEGHQTDRASGSPRTVYYWSSGWLKKESS